MGGRADSVGTDAGQLVVDGWILDRRLGSGSYGEVWRARRRHLDLVRALKLIAVDDDDAFDSWRQEISRLEELSHPNVVRFYDADLVAHGPYRGYAWIATELCDHSLATELRHRQGGVLSDAETEHFVDQMLGALSAARSRDCVHRDIKPANILRHASGVWKLCDFGTARLLPADGTHPLTQVIGTSPYMSAAALRGQQNHAADLYALAVTTHEALCGAILHPRGRDISEVDYATFVMNTPPTVSPSLSRRWQTVVEALIGRYGPLGAVELAAWFGATRGERPPRATLPSSAAAAAPPGTNGTRANGVWVPPGTSATEAAAPRATSATEAASRKVYVPAPPVPASAPPPAPGSPPPPIAPPTSPPGRLKGRDRRLADAAARAGLDPDANPPPPPKPVQVWWKEQAAQRDPSGIVRKRAVAFLIDALLLFTLCYGGYRSAVEATYDVVAGTSCDQYTSYDDCVKLPGESSLYVTNNRSVAPDLAVIAPLVLVLVVMQGITGLTPGKLLRGLRVVGPDWGKPGMRRAAIRSALWCVDGLPCFVPLVGLGVALSRPDRRRLGDLAADTYVVPRRALKAHRAAVRTP